MTTPHTSDKTENKAENTEPFSADINLSAQRKRHDLAALLPIIGALFFLSPLVSMFNQSDDASVTGTAVYLLCIWALLIICAFFLTKTLATEKAESIEDQ